MDDPARQEAGERLIERLGEQGIEYVFATFGTDHPTLIKGLARDDTPTPILAPHEMVAASAAHGYSQVTDHPSAVLVHVDVGTANLGASLHNADRSRIPLVVMAGRTPLTTGGDQPGSRSIFATGIRMLPISTASFVNTRNGSTNSRRPPTSTGPSTAGSISHARIRPAQCI